MVQQTDLAPNQLINMNFGGLNLITKIDEKFFYCRKVRDDQVEEKEWKKPLYLADQVKIIRNNVTIEDVETIDIHFSGSIETDHYSLVSFYGVLFNYEENETHKAYGLRTMRYEWETLVKPRFQEVAPDLIIEKIEHYNEEN